MVTSERIEEDGGKHASAPEPSERINEDGENHASPPKPSERINKDGENHASPPKPSERINENGGNHASPPEPSSQEPLQNSNKITRSLFISQIISIVFYVGDVGSDTVLAYQYIRNNEILNFGLTISFVLIPMFIGTIFRYKVHKRETASSQTDMSVCSGLLLNLTPIVRRLKTMRYALNTKDQYKPNTTEYEERWTTLLWEDYFVSIVHMVETLLETSPQLVLQITLLLRGMENNHDDLFQIYQYISIFISLAALTWSYAGYHRSRRRARIDKYNMSWIGSITQVLWFFFVTSSRILAISEAASVYPLLTFAVCVGHWLLMMEWISKSHQDDLHFDFQPSAAARRWIVFSVLGFIYIIALLPMEGKNIRSQYCFYYTVFFLEYTSALIVWIMWGNSEMQKYWWFFPLVMYIFCSFLIGIVFMFIYYWYFHPARGICLESRRQEDQIESNIGEQPFWLSMNPSVARTYFEMQHGVRYMHCI